MLRPKGSKSKRNSIKATPTEVNSLKPSTPSSNTMTLPLENQKTNAWAARILANPAFPQLVRDDPYLAPFAGVLKSRFSRFRDWLDVTTVNHENLASFAQGYQHFGLHLIDSKSNLMVYREYAPAVAQAHLIGEFNQWNRSSHPLKKLDYGQWEIHLPARSDGTPAIHHGERYKIQFTGANGETFDRISPWATYVVQPTQPPKGSSEKGASSLLFETVHWQPKQRYQFKHPRPPKPVSLRIYEAHVGIASTEPKIATYAAFTRSVLPRIKELGYNCIQLMAIMEHAYYASFGYQVTSFFAPSSRFGTPEELRALIDEAHCLGLVVLLDLVHSHASKNVLDGLNLFDGTDHCFFHGGLKGWHSLWDSRLFNYGHYETLRFLLSNVRYWIDEFQVDGFRFDGVTSMLYQHHGIGVGFSGDYNEYFGPGQVDEEAITYLSLANHLIHELCPSAISIAEDVSGMPGLCRPIAEGGVGFDYRLAMAVPDMWIKYLKEIRDEDWDMEHICFSLTNRRWNEASVAYAESHDQALVGDKTLAFWLMDKDMYDHMSELHSPHPPPSIDRGMALHKMIRLLTMFLAGEAYLNFIGNEFGHPEWLDFPRQGNGESYHYARRQWNLADDALLRYRYLQQFDKEMQLLDDHFALLTPETSSRTYVSTKHNGDKVIAFERWSPSQFTPRRLGLGKHKLQGRLLFVFNFHPNQSFTDYSVGVDMPGSYVVLLDTDSKAVGGHDRVDANVVHHSLPVGMNGRQASLKLYLPSRSAQVLALIQE
jgi:1,4-alpha-glucan branching enzyme